MLNMTKADFLNTLQTKLMGEITAPEIESTIRYYEEYISEAVNQGGSEEEVLYELGDPRLIAKTIIDTAGKNQMGADSMFNDVSEKNDTAGNRNVLRQFQESSLAAKVIVVSAVVIALSVIAFVLKTLIPILMPFVVIIFIIKMIYDNKRR